jgi:hypothetical protein
MEAQEAAQRLENLRNRMQEAGLQTSLRGEGMALFLFAYGKGRSVEISANSEKWWVEFRDRGTDPEALGAKEFYESSDEQVLTKSLEWLGG